jgi:hypothetical protein
MTQAQAAGKAAETAQFIRTQQKEIKSLGKEIDLLRGRLTFFSRDKSGQTYIKIAEDLAIKTAELETAQTSLNQAIELEGNLRKAAAGEFAGPKVPDRSAVSTMPKLAEDAPKAEKAKKEKFDATEYLEGLRSRTAAELDQIDIAKQAELRKNAELLASSSITAQQAADARALIEQNAYNKTRELMVAAQNEEITLAAQHEAKLASARAQAQAAIAGAMSPEDQALIRRNEQLTEMELLRQADLENEQLYQDAMLAIRQKSDAELQKLADDRVKAAEEKAKLERMAMASSFEASADIIKAFAGEQSKEYKAMLVASKSYAIAEAAVQQGIAAAKAYGAGDYWTAAIRVAGVVAQFASIYSAINSAGGRMYGGPVEAGGMYRVNENGAPEMFTASNGRQYMMPTTSGSVTPSGKIGGGGVSVIINNYAGADVQATASDDQRTITIAVNRAVSEVAGGLRHNTGPVWAAAKAGTNIQGRVD